MQVKDATNVKFFNSNKRKAPKETLLNPTTVYRASLFRAYPRTARGEGLAPPELLSAPQFTTDFN
jgi:hypothetical protein